MNIKKVHTIDKAMIVALCDKLIIVHPQVRIVDKGLDPSIEEGTDLMEVIGLSHGMQIPLDQPTEVVPVYPTVEEGTVIAEEDRSKDIKTIIITIDRMKHTPHDVTTNQVVGLAHPVVVVVMRDLIVNLKDKHNV
jgi:hypothetical protein